MKNDIRKEIIRLAHESSIACATETGLIETRVPETPDQYSENHAFWTEVFKLLDNSGSPTIKSCKFYLQKPGIPVPFTVIERIKKVFGVKVTERATPGEIVEIEANNPSATLMDIRALDNGLLYLGFKEDEAKKLQEQGVKMSLLMIPIKHAHRTYIQAGHIRNVVLA